MKKLKILVMMMAFTNIGNIVARLTCSVVNETVNLHLALPLNKHATHERTKLFFRSTNQHSNAITDYTKCVTDISGDYINLHCPMWQIKQIYYGDFTEPHLLQVINMANNEIVWDYSPNVYNPSENLFDCFPDHTIKNLRFALTNNGEELRWRTNRWDEQYNFIRSHRITIGNRVVKGRFLGNCENNCKQQINGLEPCRTYKICIDTTYYKSNKMTTSCIDATLGDMCEERLQGKPRRLLLLLHVMLGLLILLLLMVIIFVYCRRGKFRQHKDYHRFSDGAPIKNKAEYL